MSEAGQPFTALGIVYAAMECEEPGQMSEALDFALVSEDPWLLNAGILAIGHLARRFKVYPKAMKERLWVRCHAFPAGAGPQLAGTREDAEGDIRHFGARGI